MIKKVITCFNIKCDRYIAYENGQIYDTKLQRFKTTHIDKDGYHYISLETNNDGVHKKFRLNRIICQVFHPIENPECFEANHIDGNVDNNWEKNLNWLTTLENIRHSRYVLNHRRDCEDHPLNKYPSNLIHDICDAMEKGCFRAKEIVDEIEHNTMTYFINIDVESFQNLVMSIRRHSRWCTEIEKRSIPCISLRDYRGKFWDPETIRNVRKLINDGLTNRQIADQLFSCTDKKTIDYVYRIRKKGAFSHI